jgi:hypothetical protein
VGYFEAKMLNLVLTVNQTTKALLNRADFVLVKEKEKSSYPETPPNGVAFCVKN